MNPRPQTRGENGESKADMLVKRDQHAVMIVCLVCFSLVEYHEKRGEKRLLVSSYVNHNAVRAPKQFNSDSTPGWLRKKQGA